MPFPVYTHPDCLKHDTGPMHPECIARLRVILAALEARQGITLLEAPRATDARLRLAHTDSHIAAVRNASPASGYAYLDADTVMSPGSLEAALRAAGSAIAAVDDVCGGKYTRAFCAVRPPGHHALASQAMGFCMFNNIAIAALHALENHALTRVAIVDFDVHHGNGTQAIFESESRVLFISTHQSPFYPGTGYREENQPEHILNLPLPAGTDGATYRRIFTQHVLPALARFKPQLILASAGFDAHRDDPLAELRLTEEDYRWIGSELAAAANEHGAGRLISFLEGGYNLDVLGASVSAYLDGLCAIPIPK